jgi:hypothetical protein
MRPDEWLPATRGLNRWEGRQECARSLSKLGIKAALKFTVGAGRTLNHVAEVN